jgi:hypothetical protein
VIDKDLEEAYELYEKFNEHCYGHRVLIIAVAMGLLVKSISMDIPDVTVKSLLKSVGKSADMATMERMTEQ